MGMTVERNFFKTKEEVLEDIAKHGFWPTTYLSTASPELPVHHHDREMFGYVMEGESYVIDGETGERVNVGPGDKLTLPKGALHAEGEVTSRVVYIVALPEPAVFEEALVMLDPHERED